MLIHERDLNDTKQDCSFCEENKADALWMGKIDVFLCMHCATEVIPQLMADAIVGGTSLGTIEKSTGPTIEISRERRIMERFNSSFKSALIRKIRQRSIEQAEA